MKTMKKTITTLVAGLAWAVAGVRREARYHRRACLRLPQARFVSAYALRFVPMYSLVAIRDMFPMPPFYP